MLLALLLACSTPEPAPLPPPQRPAWAPAGRMVAAGDLRGYLVKPQATPAPAVLLLVPALDDGARSAADALAASGSVAFAIEPAVDAERARAYLDGLPDTTALQVRCQRPACP